MEGESQNKRNRGANFTRTEKDLLFNIISKYKLIVENKKTDGMSNEEKSKAWERIAEEFNAVSPDYTARTKDTLKKLYDNKKREVRKLVAEERKQVFLTGGGVPDIKTDPNTDIILSIINDKTVYGTEAICDSDSLPFKNKNKHKNAIVFELGEDLCIEGKEIYQLEAMGDRLAQTSRHAESGELAGSANETDQRSQLEDTLDLTEDLGDINNVPLKTDWRKYKAADLLAPKPGKLKRPQVSNESADTPKKFAKMDSSRRRPATVVKALTSSELAQKYVELINKRLEIVEYQKQEQELKIQSLELDIQIKKNN